MDMKNTTRICKLKQICQLWGLYYSCTIGKFVLSSILVCSQGYETHNYFFIWDGLPSKGLDHPVRFVHGRLSDSFW